MAFSPIDVANNFLTVPFSAFSGFVEPYPPNSPLPDANTLLVRFLKLTYTKA